MKLLYAIQGTGNGHIMRAREMVPVLKKYAKVDVLLSGTDNEVEIGMPIKYSLKGFGFVFGKHGGINYRQTVLKANTLQFLKDVKNIPVQNYNGVINDFEPVTALACKLKKVPVVAMSHQAAVINPNAPHAPVVASMSRRILHHYAPVSHAVGFHFNEYAPNIFTPVIRQDVMNAETLNLGHYTVYLPAYEDGFLLEFFAKYGTVQWQIFSKRAKTMYTEKNVEVQPVCAQAFMKSIACSEGVLCGAGFETPAEVLYLGKKLFVIPMKGQYEQQCNASALMQMGVPALRDLYGPLVHKEIKSWLNKKPERKIDYPDIREQAVQKALALLTRKN